MQLRFLTGVSVSRLHSAFLQAFSDYIIPMSLSLEQFEDLLTRRGAEFESSVGAFDGGDLVGFNINSVASYTGTPTVYDIATGVLPSHRRLGIALKMFEFSYDRFRKRGAQRYLLEVIQTNTRAVRIYERLGFQTIRLLDAFRRPDAWFANSTAPTRTGIREIQPDWQLLQSFWDWHPSWQNSIESITRSQSRAVVLGAFRDESLAGYGVIYPHNGDVAQFAVHRGRRRAGIGRELFTAMQQYAGSTAMRAVNISATDVASIGFLRATGFEPLLQQYEMELRL